MKRILILKVKMIVGIVREAKMVLQEKDPMMMMMMTTQRNLMMKRRSWS